MPPDALARLAVVREVVAGARDDPSSAWFVRSEPGGGAALVVVAVAAALRDAGVAARAVPDVSALSADDLLDLRRRATDEVLVVGADAPPAGAAASLLDYLRTRSTEVGPLDLDAVRTVLEGRWGVEVDDESAHRVLEWTGGRLGDVVEVADAVGPPPPDGWGPAALAAFAPTRARRDRAAVPPEQVDRWAVAAADAGPDAARVLVGPPTAPVDRPVDAAAIVSGLSAAGRRDAVAGLLATAAGLDAGALSPALHLALGRWWCEVADAADAGGPGPEELGHLLGAVGVAFATNQVTAARPIAERLWRTTGSDLAAVALAAALARDLPSPLLDEIDSPGAADWVAVTRSTWQLHCDHDPDAATATLAVALDAAPADAAVLDDALATLELHRGDPDGAEARILARSPAGGAETPYAVNALVLADLVRGRHRRAVDRLNDELGRRLDPGMNLSADRYRFFRAVAVAQAGWPDLDHAAELDELYGRALDGAEEWTIGWVGWGAGVHAARTGRFATAARRLRRAVAAFDRAGRPGFAMWPTAALVELSALCELDGPVVAESVVAGLAAPTHAVRLERPAAQLALALVAGSRGDRPQLVDALGSAARDARAQHETVTAIRVAIEAVLAGLGAAACTPSIDPECDGVLAEVWPLVAAGDGESLEDAGLHLVDRGHPVLGVRVLVRAEELLRRGDPRRAARARHTALSLAGGFERPLRPWVLGTSALPTLSAREREVARAIADGATRDEVAARLVVSRRTVDSHLQRIYAKVGVTNRAELREWLDTTR